MFCFKHCLPYVASCTVYKIQFDKYNGPFHGETDWYLKVKYVRINTNTYCTYVLTTY